MALKDSGTSTTDWLQIYSEDRADAGGMLRAGAVRNTGGINSLSVRLGVTDAFGGDEQQETYTVLPGMAAAFNTWSGLLGVQSPAGKLRVEVRSTIMGMHTTWEANIADGTS